MAVVDAAVGAGVGVACVTLSVALQMLARKGGGGGKSHGKSGKGGGGGRSGGKLLAKLEQPRLHIALFLAGGVGLAGTALGGWINTALTWCNAKVAALLTEWVGVGLGFLVSFALIVVLLQDIRDDRAAPRTLGMAAAAPFAVVAIPGLIGAAAAGAISFIATLVGGLVAGLFGLS